MGYKILWSDESVNNLQEIIDDIYGKWYEREVDKFKIKLSHLLDLIERNPFLFPPSIKNPHLRKAVLSKQTSIYYKVENDIVYLTYIHLNNRDQGRIK